jgi:hypothetical protein
MLQGYPYTLGLAMTLPLLAICAPLIKLRELEHRWTALHVPVVIAAPDYLEVVEGIERALAQNGFPTRRAPPPPILRLPTRMLIAFAERAFDTLTADKLTVLEGQSFELVLHPCDLIVRGEERITGHVSAIATEALTFTRAYLTWSKDANTLEERILGVWNDIRYHEAGGEGFSSAVLKLRTVDRDLRRLPLAFEEWQILAREKLLVENRLLEFLNSRRVSA